VEGVYQIRAKIKNICNDSGPIHVTGEPGTGMQTMAGLIRERGYNGRGSLIKTIHNALFTLLNDVQRHSEMEGLTHQESAVKKNRLGGKTLPNLFALFSSGDVSSAADCPVAVGRWFLRHGHLRQRFREDQRVGVISLVQVDPVGSPGNKHSIGYAACMFG